MSIKYGKDGKVVLELTEGNVRGLAELVLQHYEEKWDALAATKPGISRKEGRSRALASLMFDIDTLKTNIEAACKAALGGRPDTSDRADLLGRLLIRPVEPFFTDEADAADGVPRHLIGSILGAIREILGEESYHRLNEFSVKPSLEYCLVHDLETAQIDWEEFYSRNLSNLLMIRFRNVVRQWMKDQESPAHAFAKLVNKTYEPYGDERAFRPDDWEFLCNGWELLDAEPEKENGAAS